MASSAKVLSSGDILLNPSSILHLSNPLGPAVEPFQTPSSHIRLFCYTARQNIVISD